ncbi:hypothetical protein GIB67_026871 [Kingdonia uniflora]|uniref:Cupin type-1 domain-containing protein n=1 Tax=Kingdonia uniflora TaxID=39325 RepID=A0A7J7M841_9MAGN|nr:hypothetical protein GIB67_026871 [Kingdonia uniflora]
MASIKKLASLVPLALFFALVVVANADSQSRQSEARQCRLKRIQSSQPSQQIQSEGGVTELWDENEDQFQCAGVAAIKNRIQPNSLSLPNFHPSPRLVYIQQGKGLLGITFPGCPETFHSSGQQQQGHEQEEEEQQQGRQRSRGDLHQKIRRIEQGDIVALPAGVAHWCFNDGKEELIAVSVTDLNNQQNQLDQQMRGFYLAGGQGEQSSQGQQQKQQDERQSNRFQNVFRPFDENLMSEALNIPVDIVRKMQRDDERGLIVKVKEGMDVISPDEEESYEEGQNGLEEVACNMRVRAYLDNPREADVYNRQAGRLNLVNQQKLPILRYLDMSAEKGSLYPKAIYAPSWSINSHSIIYIIRGEAQAQVVGSNGQAVLNDKVRQGDIFVVPQHFVATMKAGSNGVDWVSFKTSSLPMRSPLVGRTSVFKALPLDVLTNSYQISIREAQDLKYNREQHTVLLPPSFTSSS